jgi:hypothetical protein
MSLPYPPRLPWFEYFVGLIASGSLIYQGWTIVGAMCAAVFAGSLAFTLWLKADTKRLIKKIDDLEDER